MFPIRDTIPAERTPWVMALLILANVAVFLFQAQLPVERLEALVTDFGMIPARDFSDVSTERAIAGQAIPFFSSVFLHGSFMHLFSNMWSLWLFGDNVEDRMGPWRFLIFYLLCGVIAGLTHAALNAGSVVPAVGASGAISGVMGAYLWMFPRSQLTMITLIVFYPLIFRLPAVLFLVIWFVGQLFGGTYALGERLSESPGAGAGIAFWAHIGGFLAGIALTPLFRRRNDRRSDRGTALAYSRRI